MVNTFYADPAVGGDGSTTTDDNDPSTGLGNDGFRARLLKMFSNIVAIANVVATKAAAVLNSPATAADSTTSLLIGTGSKTFTLTVAGKSIYVGQRVVCASKANPLNQMLGYVTTAPGAGSTLVVNVDQINGSGTFADWTISLSASAGVSSGRQILTTGLLTGGGDLSTDRTHNVPAASASDVRTGSDTTKAVTSAALMASSAFQTLTDAATIAFACASGYNASVTLTASGHTVGAPSGLYDGLNVTLEIVQDATGSRTVSWNTIWDFGAAGLPLLSTAAGHADKVHAQYNARTGKLEASFRKGS